MNLGLMRIELKAAPRADGYSPITEMLWVWPHFAGAPPDEAWRFVLSAARRLDIFPIETQRQGVPCTGSGPRMGAILGARR